jgi:hypothetical protein
MSYLLQYASFVSVCSLTQVCVNRPRTAGACHQGTGSLLLPEAGRWAEHAATTACGRNTGQALTIFDDPCLLLLVSCALDLVLFPCGEP